MGSYMRQHWIPAMLSSELPNNDSDPLRLLLLGERLIAFRDTNGRLGVIQNHCPHRGASLFFGRNEEAGLRCVYHGWKFDTEGNCVDMPNEPAESDFKSKVRAAAYPTEERGGVVWVYMGPRQTPPQLPEFEANLAAGATANANQMECNYFQVLEGTIDTVHAGYLHLGGVKADDAPKGTFAEYMLRDRAPRYSVMDTDAGVCYGAYRDGPPDQYYWRIAQFLLPFYAMAPGGLLGGGPTPVACYVPMDDYSTTTIGLSAPSARAAELARRAKDSSTTGTYRDFMQRRQALGPGTLPNTTDWHGRFRTVANAANDYLIDREVQRRGVGSEGYTGISGVGTQDQAMTNSEGLIYDRSTERLGTSDAMIIRSRRRLLNAARAFAETGATPVTATHPEYYGVRAGSTILPKGADWVQSTSELRAAFIEQPDLDWSLTGGA
jgi:nitrite reductase/ring-hydroxylating ferredoxin subunit